MHTRKGTHINPIKKRCRLPACPLVLITLLCCLSVYGPGEVFAQTTPARPWLISGKPGALSALTQSDTSLSRQAWFASGLTRSFGLRELDEPWIDIGWKPTRFSTSLSARTLGWNRMREWSTTAWFGYQLDGIEVQFGAEHKMLQLRQPYHNDHAMLFHAAVSRYITETAALQASATNVAGGVWLRGGDSIEKLLSADLVYANPDNAMMTGGITFSDHYAPDFHAHLYWMPHQALSLHLGAGSQPSRVQIGLVVNRAGWHAGSNFVKVTHTALGWKQQHWIGRIMS